MRRLASIWLFWILGALQAASLDMDPAEEPPPDFPGAQYIDSAGCVFLRDGYGWTPRLDDDGRVMCGFPPSQSAWRGGDAAAGTLEQVERDLTVALVEAGNVPDFEDRSLAAAGKDSPPDRKTGPAASMPAGKVLPDPAAGGLGQVGGAIGRALHTQPAIAARMNTGFAGSDRLCELLGMSAPAQGRHSLAADPTRGYCADLAPTGLPGLMAIKLPEDGRMAGAHDADGTTAEDDSARTDRKAKRDMPQRGKAETVPPRSAQKRPSAKAGKGRQKAHSKPRDDGDVATDHANVPAGAKYVQLGAFNHDGVEAAIAAIRALGYPAARQVGRTADGMRIVFAGPFTSRERLIAALDRIQKAGYPRAIAR